MKTTTPFRAALAALALTALLAACGGGDAAPSTQASSLTVTDPWVKAADSGMTAAFGLLANAGDADITVVSASSPATPTVELHETVADAGGAMVMQPKEGGFVVPAGGSLELAPGGNHLMFVDLTGPVAAGDEVTVTLTLGDGSTLDVVVPAKDFTGADENYVGGGATDTGDGMSGMDMGGDMSGMDMGGTEGRG